MHETVTATTHVNSQALLQEPPAHLAEHVVQQRLAQQHAVGHVLDHRLLAGAVLKADGIADLWRGRGLIGALPLLG